ncbi:autotransporter outer membrane beta-barrel domain-containing protein [Flavivirga jejuensis]|uniref:Autotransporter outer membrane beta-barrel domain-containing protein n=1 Tax=Flavivirga jejuensis TaxID=870487 RepID=A0ABT8WV16_9FLAO|nr:autotransporter outer membrane beta-barrel domain-containing protein [Flavivirga jejuensis]MDO5977003.1 autotransporter outer membrane beta-barrel domain-containing protein [Flavivirga jejuensis]
MRLVILFFMLTTSIFYSQTTIDSITVNAIKEALKEEIKEELKAALNSKATSKNRWDKLSLRGYGVINYYSNNYDTDPTLTDKFDAERLNLYLEYQFSDRISLKTEIEYEHGGTASSVDLDTQEEFGEFEQEIETGGGVKLEQVHINFKIKPYFNIRAGKIKMYFGLHQNLDTPLQYFTTTRQEMENAILPLGWYETGVEFYGTFAKRFNYRAYVVSGLDASGFSSRGWIKEGYQQRFEMVNAESFAFAARLDYKFGTHKDTYLGIGGYINDSAANRPKDDMSESAYVTLVEGHITYNENNLRFNVIGLYGNLENSNIVSLRNANLSNNLGVKRTPVGKNALGFSAELGYNILPLIKTDSKQMLYPFMRYDYYDTMQDVEGSIIDNPRWERNTITGGLNWFVHPQIVVKMQYSDRRLGSENYDFSTLELTGKKQHDRTFSTGVGFKF